MQIDVIKSVAGATLAAAVLAGCASQTPNVASSTRTVQDARVVSVEPATIVAQPDTSLGASSTSGAGGGTSAYGGQASVVTVRYADGSQGQFAIAQRPTPAFEAGEPVKVITDPDSVVLISP